MALMTEIEAVNAILSVAGDAPVTSLADDYEQARIARRILTKISREEQTKGWWFNSLTALELQPNIDNEINLPASTLSLDVLGDNGYWIQRGLRLFNRLDNTYKFTDKVEVNLIEELVWEELPQSFRQYAVTLSKEEYNNEYFGSQEVARTVERQLAKHELALKSEDLRGRDVNMLTNIRSANIAFRNRR